MTATTPQLTERQRVNVTCLYFFCDLYEIDIFNTVHTNKRCSICSANCTINEEQRSSTPVPHFFFADPQNCASFQHRKPASTTWHLLLPYILMPILCDCRKGPHLNNKCTEAHSIGTYSTQRVSQPGPLLRTTCK